MPARTGVPLVVGAGPVGLAAALFLHRAGHPVRVVERRTEPTRRSKALAVNPRTLELLEPTGVTERMLAIGERIHGAVLHTGGRTRHVAFTGVHPRHPFMLALSQAVTERLLAEALRDAGGGVERGIELDTCSAGDRPTATLIGPGGERTLVAPPWILGADGAHSTVRAASGIGFPGTDIEHDWHLADGPLQTDLPEDRAHLFFLDDGRFAFLLRVVDDQGGNCPSGATPAWRVVANRASPLEHVPGCEPVGPPDWQSSFRIAHRIAPAMTAGHVHLAGDAAHVHSPVGARGMNLGIEDAWVFARLAQHDRLADYNDRHRPTDARVVRRVERITKLADAATPWSRFVRRRIVPLALHVPFARAAMRRTVTGTDHELAEATRM